MNVVLVLLLAAAPIRAQTIVVPVPVAGGVGALGAVNSYPDKFLAAANLSLAQDPFFASRMMGSFETHLAVISTARNPAQVAAYLRGAVLAPEKDEPKGLLESLTEAVLGPESDRSQGKRFGDKLGSKSLSGDQAGALLLANALAAPEVFNQVLTGLESSKPGLGQRLARSIQNAGSTPGANPSIVAAIRKLGQKIGPHRTTLTYDSKGKLDAFFDNSR